MTRETAAVREGPRPAIFRIEARSTDEEGLARMMEKMASMLTRASPSVPETVGAWVNNLCPQAQWIGLSLGGDLAAGQHEAGKLERSQLQVAVLIAGSLTDSGQVKLEAPLQARLKRSLEPSSFEPSSLEPTSTAGLHAPTHAPTRAQAYSHWQRALSRACPSEVQLELLAWARSLPSDRNIAGTSRGQWLLLAANT